MSVLKYIGLVSFFVSISYAVFAETMPLDSSILNNINSVETVQIEEKELSGVVVENTLKTSEDVLKIKSEEVLLVEEESNFDLALVSEREKSKLSLQFGVTLFLGIMFFMSIVWFFWNKNKVPQNEGSGGQFNG